VSAEAQDELDRSRDDRQSRGSLADDLGRRTMPNLPYAELVQEVCGDEAQDAPLGASLVVLLPSLGRFVAVRLGDRDVAPYSGSMRGDLIEVYLLEDRDHLGVGPGPYATEIGLFDDPVTKTYVKDDSRIYLEPRQVESAWFVPEESLRGLGGMRSMAKGAAEEMAKEHAWMLERLRANDRAGPATP
jgi:hypothetical protein